MTEEKHPHNPIESQTVQPQWSNEALAWVYPPHRKLDPESGEMRDVPALVWDTHTNQWELLDNDKAHQIFGKALEIDSDSAPKDTSEGSEIVRSNSDDHPESTDHEPNDVVDVETAAEDAQETHGSTDADESLQAADETIEPGAEVDSEVDGEHSDENSDNAQGHSELTESAHSHTSSKNDNIAADDADSHADDHSDVAESECNEADAAEDISGNAANESGDEQSAKADEDATHSQGAESDDDDGQTDSSSGSSQVDDPGRTPTPPVHFSPFAATLYLDEEVVDRIDTPVIIGRRPQENSAYPEAQPLTINDTTKSMSKVHALLEPVKDGVKIRDLGSTNGTWIVFPGGQKLSATEDNPVVATYGALICCGTCILSVKAE